MEKVIIIAETGVNHNGDINLAKKLIDVAVAAGVDYVKFQTFKSENLVSQSARKADYQILNTQNASETQFQMLKKLELSHENHIELITYCNKKNITFLSTAFDLDSLVYLKELGLAVVKIPSGEITNLPYLRKAAELFSKVIISTGMSTIDDIENALNVFLTSGIKKDSIFILHCNTEYPTPMKDVNLLAMLEIKNKFNVEIGYSDHTLGIEIPIAAVALGAKVIEKHFTLDRSLPGPDQLASLEPEELSAMVLCIRNIELAISGNGIKQPSISEQKNMIIKRPGNGISPMKWDYIIGQVAHMDFDEDQLIELTK